MVCAQLKSIALNLLCPSTVLEIIQQVPSPAMQATYHVEAVTVQSALKHCCVLDRGSKYMVYKPIITST